MIRVKPVKWLSSLPKNPWVLIGLAVILTGFASFIPLRLAIAQRLAPEPQAILTLGGGSQREIFTAQFAQQHPQLPIWVSSGIRKSEAKLIFQNANIPEDRVILDYRAVDTVTNFTTLVSDLQKSKIKHIYLITSDFHMPRSQAIATLVLGSRGITFTSVSIPTNQPPEPWYEVLRDFGRGIVWLFTGRTGASLGSR